MAIIAMLYGQSGTGKSTSIRNFTPNDVAVINVSGNYERIDDALQRIKQPSIIIDDATYLMTNEFMRTARISGYQKFTDMALNYYTLVRRAAALPEDKIVYFIGHSETDDKGNEKFKTVGKLLDEKVTLEGLYTIVLKTVVQDGHYFFATHNSGRDTVKSPLGMFEDDLIPNDLAAVDKIIREYYGMTKETAHG